MFHTVTLLKQEDIGGNRVRATYYVKDGCFADNITLHCASPHHEKESIEVAAVLTVYMQRNRNVARNLALYYIGMQDAPTYMAADKNFIDREFSSLNYGKNTYRLVELYYRDIKQVIEDYSRNEEALIQAIKEKLNLEGKP
jgi:hypothetical protein